ncbi:nuclear transport factor 2 family protein [Tomitella biformata]|uniref:nuclear transport factor 2 family protein n=1 Tax=Tomitella biformata TaxID=630403 RepID=UPI0004668AD7|nr:nuclear transport factor 2 family protein [Tomitella biformata]
MTPSPTPAELIALVERSPAAVAVHDRDAWLALFSRSAEVCDPYGSQPARGRETLANFYATFIAPNDISFAVDHDVVAGMTVFRDLTLTTKMSGTIPLQVPMHLRYDMTVAEDGALKIEKLHAHWELPTQITQLLAAGLPGLVESTKLMPKLLGNQGISGTIGFMKGFRRAGAAGKRTTEQLFAGLKAGRPMSAPVEFPGTEPIADLSSLTWRKLLSAGHTVTATIELDGKRGVALVDFERGARRASRVQFFLPS